MGRALTAVAAALILCFLVLGSVVYFTRDEDGIAVDAILAENITRAVEESQRDKAPVRLADLTDFDWDAVTVFDPDTPRADVSRALGFPYHGQLEYTAQSSEVFVFTLKGRFARFADYRGLGRFAGLRPLQRFTPTTAVFSVRDLVARPAG